ncbi:MAG: GTPase [Sulfolobaceae archaeon]
MKAIVVSPEKYREEAISLAESADYKVLKIINIPKRRDPNFYLNRKILDDLNKEEFDSLIIFDLLKPRHFTNLQKIFINKKILDKVLLLLEVFSLHSSSIEAKLQIELARVKYELPILKDMYKKTKIGEQQGPLGSGAYGVTSIVRLYQNKIKRIINELEEIKKSRETQIMKNNQIPSIAIVGYTNVGKTSLFNALTGLKRAVDTKMFTTTIPKRYSITVNGKKLMLVDTVGFIRGIPPQIIEAFFVTLSETKYANGIILMVDISYPQDLFIESIESSFKILRDIGVSGKPLLVVANKIDKINGNINSKMEFLSEIIKKYYEPVIDIIPVSVKFNINVDKVRDSLYLLV